MREEGRSPSLSLSLSLSSLFPPLPPSCCLLLPNRAEQTDRSATAVAEEGGGKREEERRRQGQAVCVLVLRWLKVGPPFALESAGLSLLCGRSRRCSDASGS
jgi:hypothetical protein